MSDPTNEILFKSEDAVAAHLATISGSLQSATIQPGGANDTLEVPWIGVLAVQAQERQPRSNGNWRVQVHVEINTSVNDTGRATRKLIANAVSALIADDAIVASLSAAIDDFTCQGFLIGDPSQRIEGRRHVYTIALLIDCCGSDL